MDAATRQWLIDRFRSHRPTANVGWSLEGGASWVFHAEASLRHGGMIDGMFIDRGALEAGGPELQAAAEEVRREWETALVEQLG